MLMIRTTIFLTGACVLILEILGGYLLAPFFGTSLYVWTSLITTTLIFLSIGYWWGGRFADYWLEKSASKGKTGLALLLLLSGIGTFLIPWIRIPIFHWSFAYGVQWGSFVAAALLFCFPMIFLGMISPYVIRLQSQSVETTGRIAGSVFFFSTLGSVAGSLCVAHLLIPNYEVSHIALSVAFLLLFLAFIFMLQKEWLAPTLIVLYCTYAFYMTNPEPFYPDLVEHKATHYGRPVDVIWKQLDQKHSFYGKIQVFDRIEYLCSSSQTCRAVHGPRKGRARRKALNHSRLLLINSQIQTGVNWKTRNIPEFYPAGFQYTRFLNPEAKNALCIGVAGGVISKILLKMGFEVDAVEIDPELITLAHKYFELPHSEQLNLYLEDGRTFLQKTQKKYDLIFIDAFSNYTIPPHLCTQEFFQLIKEHLSEKGCLAMNATCFDSGGGSLTLSSLFATINSVFGEKKSSAYVYASEYHQKEEVGQDESGQPIYETVKTMKSGNYVFFATNGNLIPKELSVKKQKLTVDLAPEKVKGKFYRSLLQSIQTLLKNPCQWEGGHILTDEWNPIETWQMEANQLLRRDLIRFALPKGWKF